MLDASTLEADLALIHSDFQARDLFKADGTKFKAFFHRTAAPTGTNQAYENHLLLYSATALEAGDIITDRRAGQSWKVAAVENEDGSYRYTLKSQ